MRITHRNIFKPRNIGFSVHLNKIKYIVLVIGLIIIGYILWQIDYDLIYQIEMNFSWYALIILFLIIPMIFVVRTWRWQLLLRSIKFQLSFISAFALVTPAISFSLFSPAQSGDLIKIEFLKKKFGISRKESFSTVIMEKILDLLFITIFFLIGISHISIEFLRINTLYIILFILILIFFGILAIWLARNKILLVQTTLINFKLMLKDLTNFTLAIFLTIAYWSFLTWAWFLVAKLIGIQVTFLFTLELLSILSLIGIITLIPSGLGVVEISTILILSNILNINPNIAAVYSILMRLYSVLIAILGYLPFLIDIRKIFKLRHTPDKRG